MFSLIREEIEKNCDLILINSSLHVARVLVIDTKRLDWWVSLIVFKMEKRAIQYWDTLFLQYAWVH